MVWLFSDSRLSMASFCDGPPYHQEPIEGSRKSFTGIRGHWSCSISRLSLICMLIKNKLLKNVCMYNTYVCIGPGNMGKVCNTRERHNPKI